MPKAVQVYSTKDDLIHVEWEHSRWEKCQLKFLALLPMSLRQWRAKLLRHLAQTVGPQWNSSLRQNQAFGPTPSMPHREPAAFTRAFRAKKWVATCRILIAKRIGGSRTSPGAMEPRTTPGPSTAKTAGTNKIGSADQGIASALIHKTYKQKGIDGNG